MFIGVLHQCVQYIYECTLLNSNINMNSYIQQKDDLPLSSSAEKKADRQSWSVTCGPRKNLWRKMLQGLSGTTSFLCLY